MKILKMASFFIALAILAWQPAKTFADPAATRWQSHAAIRTTAQSFVDAFAASHHEGRTQIKLGQLDQRLRLKSCAMPLEAFMPDGGRVMGNTTIGIRCSDEGGWSIYVSAKIDVFGPVLVARQPIPRGTPLREGDLELVERNLSNLPYGYYSDPQPVVDQLAKRTIAAATVVTPSMLKAPKLVKRGELVSVIAETGVLKIRTRGKALGDGKAGDLVRVRTEGSRRVIDGVVMSAGVVKVTL
jgi:flagella basal body P-ring formation protein FlgA